MKKSALLLTLGLSLLFNIFVLVGFIQARVNGPGQPPHPGHAPRPSGDEQRLIERMAQDLNLTPEQRKLLATLREDQRKQAEVIDQSIALVRENLTAELRKDSPDVERIRSLVSEEADLNRSRRVAGASLFGEFVGELTPAQRRELVGRFMRGPREEGPRLPPDVFKRFDQNGNGRLDPEELRAARQEMDKRRRDLPPLHPPPQFWRQFDKNNDEQLDREEIAAMDEFLRQFPAGGMRPGGRNGQPGPIGQGTPGTPHRQPPANPRPPAGAPDRDPDLAPPPPSEPMDRDPIGELF